MYERVKLNLPLEELYESFLGYVKGYMDKLLPPVTNYSNFSALVYDFFEDVNWAGFYLLEGDRLILGPFQGKPACTEIKIGTGVCGTSALQKKSIVVEDTSLFPGHIVCDSASRSEIVIPIIKNSRLIGVLDVDSPRLNRFQYRDLKTLEKAIDYLIDIL